MYSHVIWDADGVLLDSAAQAHDAARRILELFGETPTIRTSQDHRLHFGRERQSAIVGEDNAEVLRALHRLLMRHTAPSIPLFDDVLAIVARVQVPCSIATSAFATGVEVDLRSAV